MVATNTGQMKESYGREKGNHSIADRSQEWIFRSYSADSRWLLGSLVFTGPESPGLKGKLPRQDSFFNILEMAPK